jgi:2,4-dienoyl-CoA reductase-like NADH-dependent reductase (Old Yellow Enzyme family)
MAPSNPPQPPYPSLHNAPSLPDQIGYFTPHHTADPGVPFPNSKTAVPTIFTPLRIRDVTLRNRIIVAPMCQYSTAGFGDQIGALTDYHIATLGHYALKGASLVFIEATGVQPNGRISPNCPGIWDDKQIPGVKRVADFIKSQGSLCGIQLAHAGRKSSTVAPWVTSSQPGRKISARATEEVGGWPDNVVGPMGGESEAWDLKGSSEEGGYYPPRALSEPEIKELVKDWGRAAERAVKAGVDVIEIHGAHGYLIHQFLSPVTNRRTDGYGGSWEGRTRLLKEIVQEVRSKIPQGMPLFLRLSSTEWLDDTDVEKEFGGSWKVEDTIEVSKQLSKMGVDLLDVSSGGNHPGQKVNMFASKDYQIKIAAQVREELKKSGLNMLIGAVGLITEADQAKNILQSEQETNPQAQPEDLENGPGIKEEAEIAKNMVQKGDGKEPMADVILVARQFMREPEWVLKVGWKLGIDVAWPSQFLRVRFPKL